MALPDFDRNGEATIVAAEGRAALSAGDTVRAREKYDAAGELIERSIAGVWKQSQKHFLRFLAASQYYHGGNYRKALELCQKIEVRLLPDRVRGLFAPFLRDVKSRSVNDYTKRTQQKLAQLWRGARFDQVLELIRENPYAFSPARNALIRAAACAKLRNYKVAALFSADALRWQPENISVVLFAIAFPLVLPGDGRLDEAWECVQYQIEFLPHALTYLAASLVCFNLALVADGANREGVVHKQIQLLNKAESLFSAIPIEHANQPMVQRLFALGVEAAAVSRESLSKEPSMLADRLARLREGLESFKNQMNQQEEKSLMAA